MEMEKESENRICIIFVEMHIPLHTKPTWKHVSNGVATYGYEFGARFSIQARTMQQNTKCDLTILIFSVFYMIFCCCVCATSIARCRFFRFISVFSFGCSLSLSLSHTHTHICFIFTHHSFIPITVTIIIIITKIRIIKSHKKEL